VAKTKNDKDEETTTADPGAGQTGYAPTPGQEPGPSAATLEEALAKQDELGREGSEEAAAESGEAKAIAEAEAEAAIAEAGAAQEARDDEVYGRTPAEPDAEATPASE
jgi:hypothetical protein